MSKLSKEKKDKIAEELKKGGVLREILEAEGLSKEERMSFRNQNQQVVADANDAGRVREGGRSLLQ